MTTTRLGPYSHHIWAVFQEALNPGAGDGWDVQVGQLLGEDVLNDEQKKNHPDIASLSFHVTHSSIKNSGNGMTC